MSDQWYCKVVGEEAGPITEDDLRAMFESGQIAGNDMIRSSDHTAWQRLSRVFPGMAASAPERRTWYFRSFGDDFGPYSFTELKEFVSQEQLTPTDDVREGEEGEWKPARVVTDLFPAEDELLAGMEALDDAPVEAAPRAKPSPESKPRSKKRKRKRAGKEDSESAAAAFLEDAPEERPAPQPEVAAPAADVVPPGADEIGTDEAPEVAESTAEKSEDRTPVESSPSPPAPAYTPAKPPPPPRRSSGGGGAGGMALPDWLVNGKTVGIAVGLVVLLGGGYFLMGSGLLNFNAGPVYQQTVTLYEEFKTVSKSGSDSPEFQKFYKEFRAKQFKMLSAVGDASPGSSTYQVHRAVQTLGSVIQSFRRESMTQEARQVYVNALEKQLKELQPIYGK